MECSRDPYIDARQAARFLGLSRRTLWTLAAAGKIPHVRPGGRRCIRFQLDELERWARRDGLVAREVRAT